MKKKGVVFLLNIFPNLGGIENITVRLANKLVDEGFRVYIYGEKGDIELNNFKINPNIEVYVSEKGISSQHFCQYVVENEIDIVVNQGCWESLTPVVEYCVKNTDAKVISVLHLAPKRNKKISKAKNRGSFVKRLVKGLSWPIYEIWCYKKTQKNFQRLYEISSKIVLLSKLYIPDFVKLLDRSNVQEDRIIAIPNFIPDMAHAQDVEKEKIVIYIGRLIEVQKRFSRLVDIWGEVSKKNPDWKFLVVGDGLDSEYYKKVVKQREIERIEFCGYKEDVSQYLQRASILMLASDYEGLPLVVLEAQYNRCVPIAYDSFLSIYDIIDSEKDGIIVESFDQNSYISKLDDLMKNNKRLEEMSIAAKEKGANFSSSAIVKEWKKLFESI